MARPLIMVICVLVVLAPPRFIYGSPVIDHSRSASNTLTHNSKPEDVTNYEQKKATIMSIICESASIPVKSRQKRMFQLSDQRLAELETLMTLSLVGRILSEARYKNPATLNRHKRAMTRLTSLNRRPPSSNLASN
ncbi:uncharacterized protein LOC116851139 [Odontomachus brunneus]|uniref:uncharacterized protein LOC116851139 n=1 Tax=Odontomachus brunneus TaxID=486640 RepID=UPI0013F266D5|nr:uncharacterized protein LOC116851139 [Odontomachus brunneus]